MKQLIIMSLITSCCMIKLSAHDDIKEKEQLKMSGQAVLMSLTNSNLTGGFFSQTPAVRGLITASKGGFRFTAGRNSDLADPKSNANFCMFFPSYTKTFGNFSATLATELYLFDQNIAMDFIVPALTLTRKGVINIELLALYGYSFQGSNFDNLITQRLAISKEYAGYTFKLTGWNVCFGTHRQALALEVSKKLTEKIHLFVSGNINHNYDTDITQKFGAVRLAYSF